MAKKIRVVTTSEMGKTEPRPAPVIRVASENPKVPKLTENEIKARIQRKKIATQTSFGHMMRTGGDVMDSGQFNGYSPQLSTDFLEKPQNVRERRAFYRFMYNTNEIVGRAIDIHTTLPLSKLRLVPPKGKNPHQNKYVMKFFEDMCDNMKLFKSLLESTHDLNLFGLANNFIEDDDPFKSMTPEEISQEKEKAKQKSEFLKEKFGIIDKNPLFKGWKKLIVLPPDQVRIRKLPLSDDVAIEYIPDAATKEAITQGSHNYQGSNPGEERRRVDIPEELQDKVRQSGVIPLDTDPYTGSFVYVLSRRKSQYEPMGVSMIERCTGTLTLLDKLRQAQTSIASRHMTPMRVIWATDLNPEDVDNLREQVDMALVDPDFSIIANYEINWEEMGSNGRLLDIEAINEDGLNRLLAGLGITREILTGEGSYSGSRIGLEIMNTEYLLFRELIQDFVENYLFKPVAKKKGFVEFDEYGNESLIYPRLSFTRLAIRDNDRFFDAAFQLYQKGSISIDLILDILNIDPVSTKEKIEGDLFTVNDSIFNELMRAIYTGLAVPLVDNTDLTQKVADYLKLHLTTPEAVDDGVKRFGSTREVAPVALPEPKRVTVQDSSISAEAKDKALKMAKIMAYLKDNPELLEKVFTNVDSRGK